MRPTSKDKAGSRRQSSCATLPFATPTETSLQRAPPALYPLSPRKGQSASAPMGQQLRFEGKRPCQRAPFPSCLQMGVKSPCLLWPGEGLHISTVGNSITSLPPGLLCPTVPPVRAPISVPGQFYDPWGLVRKKSRALWKVGLLLCGKKYGSPSMLREALGLILSTTTEARHGSPHTSVIPALGSWRQVGPDIQGHS